MFPLAFLLSGFIVDTQGVGLTLESPCAHCSLGGSLKDVINSTVDTLNHWEYVITAYITEWEVKYVRGNADKYNDVPQKVKDAFNEGEVVRKGTDIEVILQIDINNVQKLSSFLAFFYLLESQPKLQDSLRSNQEAITSLLCQYSKLLACLHSKPNKYTHSGALEIYNLTRETPEKERRRRAHHVLMIAREKAKQFKTDYNYFDKYVTGTCPTVEVETPAMTVTPNTPELKAGEIYEYTCTLYTRKQVTVVWKKARCDSPDEFHWLNRNFQKINTSKPKFSFCDGVDVVNSSLTYRVSKEICQVKCFANDGPGSSTDTNIPKDDTEESNIIIIIVISSIVGVILFNTICYVFCKYSRSRRRANRLEEINGDNDSSEGPPMPGIRFDQTASINKSSQFTPNQRSYIQPRQSLRPPVNQSYKESKSSSSSQKTFLTSIGSFFGFGGGSTRTERTEASYYGS